MSILQFSKYFQLIFDNSNANNDKQIKQKIANFSELSNFSSWSFWGKPFWNQKLFLLTASGRRSCYTLVRPFLMLSCFPNKNNVVETRKYCVYYVSEHLKYCSQINEYWLNKNACLNIVLHIPLVTCQRCIRCINEKLFKIFKTLAPFLLAHVFRFCLKERGNEFIV